VVTIRLLKVEAAGLTEQSPMLAHEGGLAGTHQLAVAFTYAVHAGQDPAFVGLKILIFQINRESCLG
jgi:hypothetical protein